MSSNSDQAAIPPPMAVPPVYLYKVEARRHLLVDVGFSTAAYWSRRIEKTDGIKDAVVFQEKHALLESIVTRYFALSVAGFKDRHEFPEGERINNAKIAALMVKRCLDDGSHRLFSIAPQVHTEGRQRLINGDYLYRLFLATVEATPGTIERAVPNKNLRQMMERDLRLCLTRAYEVAEEWLAVTALSYSVHYGIPRDAVA